MNKKTNKKIIALLFFVIFGLTLCFDKSLADGEKGVWMNMLVIEPSDRSNYEFCRTWNHRCATLKKVNIFPNINFPRLDDIEGFGTDRKITNSTYKYAEVNVRAEIYIPDDGDTINDNYRFHFDTGGNVTNNITLGSANGVAIGGSGYVEISNVTPGWKHFVVTSYISNVNSDPRLILRWSRRGGEAGAVWGPITSIPNDYLSWQNYSDSEITIPADTKDKKPIGYYTSGVGVEEKTSPKIKIIIPEESEGGPSNEDFESIYNLSSSTEGAYLFWYAGGNDSNPKITIRNNSISSEDTSIIGTRIQSMNGVYQDDTFAKIPFELVKFNEANREMEFEFPNVSSEKLKQGIGIILPYINDYINPATPLETPKPTRLKLKFTGFSTYRSTHPRVIFDLDDDIKNNNLRPLFFFPDGDTRFSKDDPISFRPNYMYRIIGSDEKPSATALIQNDTRASRIFPYQSAGSLDMNNPDTWYPVFGREGNSFDALSTEDSYLPNEVNNYKRENPSDAVIQSFDADKKDWVAFQWYSSNFGSDNTAGNPESGGISMIGLLGETKDRRLAICSDVSKTIYKKDILKLKAWFWDNYMGSGDPCDDENIAYATDVTNEAKLHWISNNPAVLGVENESEGSFVGVTAGVTKAKATYEHSSGDIEALTDIDVIELDTCIYNLCDETTGWVCKSVTKVGTSTCPPNSTVPPGATCEPDRPWKEVAP